MNNFVLYLHIAPNGKKYFGITGMKPQQRWRNGHGYKKQRFYEAIEEFSWNNIGHYILADDLTEDEAELFEVAMIALYDTTNPENGYNDATGGKHHNLSERAKQKMSEARKGRKLTEEWRQKIAEACRGRLQSEEWKNFLSESQKGIKNNCVRPVICLTTKRIFITTVDAAKYYNLKQPNVTNCCIGKVGNRKCKSAGKTSDGKPLVWRYLNHKHNNIYHIAGGYFVDNQKIARLIEESFGQDISDEEIALLIEDTFGTDEPIDYENLSDII